MGPFLTVSDPVPGGVLVVEGWAPDYVMEAAAAEFKQDHYAKLFVTGIPLSQGGFLSEDKNHAYVGAATLLKLGLTTNDVQAVPTDKTRRDRTYNMALSLKQWLRAHDLSPTKVNLITAGPHARRSRLLFEKAMGKGVTVGVVAIPDRRIRRTALVDFQPRGAHRHRGSARLRLRPPALLPAGGIAPAGAARPLFQPASVIAAGKPSPSSRGPGASGFSVSPDAPPQSAPRSPGPSRCPWLWSCSGRT